MATLKEHQAAMVDLLANGSGIPASASRLAHAMHDLIQHVLMDQEPYEKNYQFDTVTGRIIKRSDATTPGLNDKALSKREKALKADSPAKWPTPAEQRVKELENTIKQLKANNAKLKDRLSQHEAVFTSAESELEAMRLAEQAGCRKEDTPVCSGWSSHEWRSDSPFCLHCGKTVHQLENEERLK